MENLLALQNGAILDGDYRIRRVLGAGGFGITYLATEIPLNRSVAIKEYFPGDFAAREGPTHVRHRSEGCKNDYAWGLERFIEEAQTLARFDHANIVRVYRYLRANNTAYMVLKFEQGQSFKIWLESLGRPPVQAELDAILKPLLDALVLIHNHDFLHRDIAPDNIIIRYDGSPVLIDFGSARGDVANHSRTVSALVKPGYSPFEQYAVTGRQQGPWTDIYSLGATLYHAITGARPLDAPSRLTGDQVKSSHDAALDDYRPGFLSAIDQALALQIEDRPQSIGQWRKTLFGGAPKARPAEVRTQAVEPPPPSATRKLGSGTPPPLVWRRHNPGAKKSDMDSASKSNGPDNEEHLPRADMWRKRAAAEKKSGANLVAQLPQIARIGGNLVKAPIHALSGALAGFAAGLPERKRNWQNKRAAAILARRERADKRAKKAAIDEKRKSNDRDPQAAGGAVRKAKAKKPRPGIFAANNARRKKRRARARANAQPPTFRRRASRFLTKASLLGALSVAIVYAPQWISLLQSMGVVNARTSAVTDFGLIRTLRGHRGPVTALAVSLDGKLVASSSTDGFTNVWIVKTGAPLKTLSEQNSTINAIDMADNRLIMGLEDGSVAIWDLDKGKLLRRYKRHSGPVLATVFGDRPTRFFSAGSDGRVKAWDTRRGLRRTYKGHTDMVRTVAYTADRKLLVSGGADDTIKLWNAKRRRLLRTFHAHTDDISSVAITTDGSTIASGSYDRTVKIWSTSNATLEHTLDGHGGRVTSVDFSPDGRLLASASEDNTVKLWDVRTGKLIHTYIGHSDTVRAVAFFNDGHRIASAGEDGTVRIWHARFAGIR